MARRRVPPVKENHERWLLSYADFITLLFALFVVMFASSQSNRSTAGQISESVRNAFNNGASRTANHHIHGSTGIKPGRPAEAVHEPEPELAQSMRSLSQNLAKEVSDGKLEVHLESRGLVVSLRQAAFFPSGGDEVSSIAFESLAKIADTLRSLPNSVQLEGHTDSIPVHNAHFRSNWELSAARSIAMLEILRGKFGLTSKSFAIAGYADTSPVDSNETSAGREHNRRVDVVILNQTKALEHPLAKNPQLSPK